MLDGAAPADEVCSFYGLPAPGGGLSLAAWGERCLARAAVVGDHWDWQQARFSVRTMVDGRIAGVGLGLPPPAQDQDAPAGAGPP